MHVSPTIITRRQQSCVNGTIKDLSKPHAPLYTVYILQDRNILYMNMVIQHVAVEYHTISQDQYHNCLDLDFF